MSDLDIDFSDIATKKEVKTSSPEEQKQTKPKATGITLTFKNDKDQWVSKDLGECTPEEFVQWAAEVYPSPLDPKSFQRFTTRVNAFNEILRFHSTPLFTKKDQQKILH